MKNNKDFPRARIRIEVASLQRKNILTKNEAYFALTEEFGYGWDLAIESLERRNKTNKHKKPPDRKPDFATRILGKTSTSFKTIREDHGSYLLVGKVTRRGTIHPLLLPMNSIHERDPYPVTEAGHIPVCLVFVE